MVNLADPIGSFQMAPNLANPIAPYRPAWLGQDVADSARALA